MIAEAHSLKVQRTARYYTLGKLNNSTTTLWIVVHGYAQLAGEFIKQFESLVNDNTAVVAPEALSRFYPKVTQPTIGATWMTREDRLNEIDDYVQYLTQLHHLLMPQIPNVANINILGFSQGCATVARWVAAAQPTFNQLWLCGGEIPKDLAFDQFKLALTHRQLHVMIGNNDPLITPAQLEAAQQLLAEKQIAYQLHTFDGVHEVKVGLLG